MDASPKFDKRVRRITEENRRVARGHATYIDEMGILRKRASGRRRALPLKGLLYLFLGFTFFKAIILASDGPASYAQRLEVLREGSLFEQLGALTLYADPLTRFIASYLAPWI